MKYNFFTGKNVLWGSSKENNEEIQKMLDTLIPGAKTIILPDEILNYEPTEEELNLLGLSTKKEKELVIDEKDFVSKFDSSELKINIDEIVGIILNNKTLNNKKYNENNESKAA